MTPDQLLVAMRLTLQYSTCTSHPLFFNQLYGGPEPAGIAGVAGLSSFITAHLPASRAGSHIYHDLQSQMLRRT